MKYKYPRTPHLPNSKGATSDDKIIDTLDHFIDKVVVVTEKMDGENSTLARDYYHARSLDSRDHPSRSWLKALWGRIRHDIPEGYRICGENLYAKHSLHYSDLNSYFYGFSVWDETNTCLSWQDTIEYLTLLGLDHVPVLYTGPFNKLTVNIDESKSEGYVVRLQSAFHYDNFAKSVAKYVRCNHVGTDEHWMHSAIIPNKLKI